MKLRTRKRPLKQRGDSKKMLEAIAWAEKHGLEIVRTTDYCVQIEGINFFPDRGTIQIDDEPRCKERGLPALARMLRKAPPNKQPSEARGKSSTEYDDMPTVEVDLIELDEPAKDQEPVYVVGLKSLL